MKHHWRNASVAMRSESMGAEKNRIMPHLLHSCSAVRSDADVYVVRRERSVYLLRTVTTQSLMTRAGPVIGWLLWSIIGCV